MEMKKKVVENAKTLKIFSVREILKGGRRATLWGFFARRGFDNRLAVIKDSNAYTFRQSLTMRWNVISIIKRTIQRKRVSTDEKAR
ncbi:MAG: hypothetical protein ACLRSW_04680 [Christensenellaceae bacterium]